MSPYQYIYGPVFSWRLGRSLGIDPLSAKEKICNFDCIYCQLGRTKQLVHERQVFVETADLIGEINALPEIEIDCLTFSGRGEPTLAKNLGEMIRALRQVRKEKIAVITNSTFMGSLAVQDDLSWADIVMAKLDAGSQEMLGKIGGTTAGVRLEDILQGLRNFRKKFSGHLALQIMFIEQNKKYAPQMAQIAHTIGADEIQINTPLRACASRPLSRREMKNITACFFGLPTVSVYDTPQDIVEPMDRLSAVRRHGQFRKLNRSFNK
ncbi:MAG: hypothetical protein A2787_01225 [Omnitrophica WOR_2 bacterium RIFCSPHIGHO2_01_FULL_48_9]|nr:MAG: hypothetical protein A2787_01225 [Omnitrophica WOR_2 bacterium RIFCSPHIGHO2_01_FULL_48_9]